VLGDAATDVMGGEVEALPAQHARGSGYDAGECGHGRLLDIKLTCAATEARQVQRDAAVSGAQGR